MAYAQGKYSRAICDRCGFDFPYLDLRKEWTGFKVCGECYEPKHPQLTPSRSPTDPEALYEPRPTISAPTTGFGIIRTSSPNPQYNNTDDIIGTSWYMKTMTGSLGTVTVTT
jgi:hypothetical protein